MKKIFGILITILLALFLFSGCSIMYQIEKVRISFLLVIAVIVGIYLIISFIRSKLDE